MAASQREWLLIVGLGNPGREYEHNRHNVGFDCVDLLAERYGISFDKSQHKARLGMGQVSGRRTILAKPQTYVNSSGEAVGPVARYYRVSPRDILVVYDDLDLPQGTIRVRPSGSSGGHNGIRSIIEHLGTHWAPARAHGAEGLCAAGLGAFGAGNDGRDIRARRRCGGDLYPRGSPRGNEPLQRAAGYGF
jgi:hypothetical protein